MGANSRLKVRKTYGRAAPQGCPATLAAPLGWAGEDFIETKDGKQDDLECDSGNDIARVDFGDRIARPWLCRIMDLDFGELPFYEVG